MYKKGAGNLLPIPNLLLLDFDFISIYLANSSSMVFFISS